MFDLNGPIEESILAKPVLSVPPVITKHSDLIPKDFDQNVDFRKELILMAANDRAMQETLWWMCHDDILFYLNCFCIAAGTPVVTDRGLVPIEQVNADDLVWDGQEWVSQGGALRKGRKAIIFRYGIGLTPDHKVWTKHGWKIASEGHDRAEVRTPDCAPSRRELRKNDAGRMAMPLRLRKRNSGRRRFSQARMHKELRVRSTAGTEADARKIEDKYLRDMDGNAWSMPSCYKQALLSVRRSRNSSVREVVKVREFSGGYGSEADRPNPRPHRQRRQLRAQQLPVGDTEAAGEQHSPECFNQNIQGHTLSARGCESGRDNVSRYPQKAGGWTAGQRFDCAEQKTEAEVYDLINCGPRRAFTVVGDDGRLLLVHNCEVYEPRGRGTGLILPFITPDWQDHVILEHQKRIDLRDLATIKSRDMRLTWSVLAVIEHTWHFREHSTSLLIALKKENVDSAGNPKGLFQKLDKLHANQPEWLLPRGRIYRTAGHLEHLDMLSTVDGEATQDYSATGDRRTILMIDELSKMRPSIQRQIMRATDDVTHSRFCPYTPNGTGTKAYELSKDPEWDKLIVHWPLDKDKAEGIYWSQEHRDGVRYPQGFARSPWYDHQVKRRGLKAAASELDIAFMGSASPFFTLAAIEKMKAKACAPWQTGSLIYDPDSARPKGFKLDPAGIMKLWCQLDRHGKPPANEDYIVGCDPSGGTGASNSTLVVMGMTSRRVVARLASKWLLPNKWAMLAVAVCRWFRGPSGEAKLKWEANGGSGTTFGVTIMDETDFRNIYWREGRDDDAAGESKITTLMGWYSNKDAKRHLLNQVNAAIEADPAKITVQDAECLDECAQYVTTKTGLVQHAGSVDTDEYGDRNELHGDMVIGLALAYSELPLLDVESSLASNDSDGYDSEEWEELAKEASRGRVHRYGGTRQRRYKVA